MKKVISDNDKIGELINYYKEKGLLIVGLNDSQGVNTTSTFFKKGLLEYLAAALTKEEFIPEVINAFSLTMNKTEHIDYFLNNNLSLEEIKLSQIYSVISALEKVAKDIGLPKVLGQIGNIYRLIYTPKQGDENIKITESLRRTEEPVMIYSSGVNDLMREVGANPFGIKAMYKARDKKPNYYYTLEKTKNPSTLLKVMGSIEKNYINILDINPNTDIYTLGAYIPASLRKEEMNIFRELVIAYNEALSTLCKQYGITFVDTEKFGKRYNHSENNFHISTAGHNALANYILELMYQKKILSESKNLPMTHYEISNKGSEGIMDSLSYDYGQSWRKAEELCGYPKERELSIAAEHKREIEIFEKVYQKRSK